MGRLDRSGCMGRVYKMLRVWGVGVVKCRAARGKVLGIGGIRIREREGDRARAGRIKVHLSSSCRYEANETREESQKRNAT